MKTNLPNKSNAILREQNLDNIAIITCSRGIGDISEQVKQAIRDHFVLPDNTEIKITCNYELTNVTEFTFFAEWVEDGEDVLRDFEIEVLTTY